MPVRQSRLGIPKIWEIEIFYDRARAHDEHTNTDVLTSDGDREEWSRKMRGALGMC